MADMRLFVNGVMGLSAGSQAPAWEFGAGSSGLGTRVWFAAQRAWTAFPRGARERDKCAGAR